MRNTIHDTGVAKHIGNYSDAMETAPGQRFLFTSGTPGVMDDGQIPPDFESQARRAWVNVIKALNAAGMSLTDLVKVTTSLTRAEDIKAYVPIRKEILGDDIKPAFMLQVISGMVRPDILIEVEIIAAA